MGRWRCCREAQCERRRPQGWPASSGLLGYADSGHGERLYADPRCGPSFAPIPVAEAATRRGGPRAGSRPTSLPMTATVDMAYRDHVHVHAVGAEGSAPRRHRARLLGRRFPRPARRAVRSSARVYPYPPGSTWTPSRACQRPLEHPVESRSVGMPRETRRDARHASQATADGTAPGGIPADPGHRPTTSSSTRVVSRPRLTVVRCLIGRDISLRLRRERHNGQGRPVSRRLAEIVVGFGLTASSRVGPLCRTSPRRVERRMGDRLGDSPPAQAGLYLPLVLVGLWCYTFTFTCFAPGSATRGRSSSTSPARR